MTHKIIIAKDGFNAKTETNPNNLRYSSDYDSLKYYLSGTLDFGNTTDTSSEMTFDHNLGYQPFFIVYTNFGAPGNYFFMCPFYFDDFLGSGYAYAYVTSTQLVCRFDRSGTGSINPVFHYKIFRNTIQE